MADRIFFQRNGFIMLRSCIRNNCTILYNYYSRTRAINCGCTLYGGIHRLSTRLKFCPPNHEYNLIERMFVPSYYRFKRTTDKCCDVVRYKLARSALRSSDTNQQSVRAPFHCAKPFITTWVSSSYHVEYRTFLRLRELIICYIHREPVETS